MEDNRIPDEIRGEAIQGLLKYANMLRINQPIQTNQGTIIWDGGNTTIVRGQRKIGRNERCPCGSGIKFKRCCGKDK